MQQRIRYIKDDNGNYVTYNRIKDESGGEYRCGFLSDGKHGFVKSTHDTSVNVPLKASSPHKMKMKIKKTLVKLGCLFKKEERQKRDVNE